MCGMRTGNNKIEEINWRERRKICNINCFKLNKE
jgi:hypothetical protein